jgi:hypothetical protein
MKEYMSCTRIAFTGTRKMKAVSPATFFQSSSHNAQLCNSRNFRWIIPGIAFPNNRTRFDPTERASNFLSTINRRGPSRAVDGVDKQPESEFT